MNGARHGSNDILRCPPSLDSRSTSSPSSLHEIMHVATSRNNSYNPRIEKYQVKIVDYVSTSEWPSKPSTGAMHADTSPAFRLLCLACPHNLCTIRAANYLRVLVESTLFGTSCSHLLLVFFPMIVTPQPAESFLSTCKVNIQESTRRGSKPPTFSVLFQRLFLSSLENCFRPYRDRLCTQNWRCASQVLNLEAIQPSISL